MSRPRVRTAALPAAEVAALKKLFGTVANAYRQVMPGGSAPLTWKVFSEVAAGRPAKPSDLATYRKSLSEWKQQNLRT